MPNMQLLPLTIRDKIEKVVRSKCIIRKNQVLEKDWSQQAEHSP